VDGSLCPVPFLFLYPPNQMPARCFPKLKRPPSCFTYSTPLFFFIFEEDVSGAHELAFSLCVFPFLLAQERAVPTGQPGSIRVAFQQLSQRSPPGGQLPYCTSRGSFFFRTVHGIPFSGLRISTCYWRGPFFGHILTSSSPLATSFWLNQGSSSVFFAEPFAQRALSGLQAP